jgi:hypothetical protein
MVPKGMCRASRFWSMESASGSAAHAKGKEEKKKYSDAHRRLLHAHNTTRKIVR